MKILTKTFQFLKKFPNIIERKHFFPIEFEILGKILQFFLNLKYYRKKKIFSYKKGKNSIKWERAKISI